MACILSRPWGTAGRGDRAKGYFLGLALVRAAALTANGRLGSSLCGFQPAAAPEVAPTDPWEPGNAGNVVFTVSNENEILDDAWDFQVNGVTVANYDGGGQTTLQFSQNIDPGQSLALRLVYATERNDNLFRVTVTVNGIEVVNWSEYLPGEPGDIINLGIITT